MVLQQEHPILLWGTAEPGENVKIELRGGNGGGAEATVSADDGGKWRVELPAMTAAEHPGPLEIRVSGVSGAPQVREDVLLGELWLASGQSNMARSMKMFPSEAEPAREANDPELRLFTVEMVASGEPLDEVRGSWEAATPSTVREFSAVGYQFAEELRQELGVPVGVICSAWGGTGVESWTPKEYLERTAPGRRHLDALADRMKRADELTATYEAEVAEWEKTRPPRRPEPPALDGDRHAPGNLWNAMIHPLLPLPVAGVIWYQGEQNAAAGPAYRELFPMMIHAFRDGFGQRRMPFFFVQLPNYTADKEQPVDQPWPYLREAQLLTDRSVRGTGMAVTIDIGDPDDIHPDNKAEVGRRLSLLALHGVYGREALVASGPLYRDAAVDGKAIRVRFDHTDGGLKAADEGPVAEVAVAGADKKFVWADATIDGDELVVSSPEVSDPRFVRYAWANNPGDANLVNGAGLPASPFRTDP